MVRRLWSVLVIVTVACLAPIALGAQGKSKPNFSGDWVIVAEKSSFELGRVPDVLTMTITQTDPAFKVVSTRWADKTVGQPTEATESLTIDGQPHAQASPDAGATTLTTVTQWDGSAIVSHTGADTTAGITSRFELADGDRTLTVTRKFTTQAGQTFTNKIVLTKK